MKPGDAPLVGRPARMFPGGLVSLALIVCAAGLIRAFELGRLSFWYDEVVSMRLGRAGGLGGLVKLLFEIDATRAFVHPLLLSGWIGLFGPSEASARGFSVACGLAAVVVIHGFGRAAFGTRAGLWAGWLAATSPILVVYSREARMYAWLILVACVAWRSLLSQRGGRSWAFSTLHAVSLAVLVYSHPLGLIMAATIAAAGLWDVNRSFGGIGRWLVLHLAALAMVAPWLRFYLDHDPEFTSGRLSPWFLLGTPIGFLGGNFALQPVLIGIIVWGVTRQGRLRSDSAEDPGRAVGFLVTWLIVPPTLLYGYSLVSHPVFGPARYTAFCAPPFLILVGLGMANLPAWGRYPLAMGLAVVSGQMIGVKAYDPELKADWRGMAARAGEMAVPAETLVIVVSADEARNVEVETARYYFGARCRIASVEGARRLEATGRETVFLAVPGRRGLPLSPPPESIGPWRFERVPCFVLDGLIVYLGVRGGAIGGAAPGSSTGSASAARS